MKRLVILFCTVILCAAFSSCNLLTSSDSGNLEFNENAAYESNMTDSGDSSFIFTYLSYMELAVNDSNKSEKAYKKYISSLFESMKEIGVTDCFVQVRPYGDAFYASGLFPKSEYCRMADFDVLSAVISCAKAYDIDIHAWINPYRCGDNWSYFAFKKGSEELIETPSGVYFNPSSLKVQRLIIDGVKELIEGYDIKGIHIDDYFYPSDVNSADKESFDNYRKSSGKLSLSDWRRENVNSLIASLYSAVKSYNEDMIFSISPGGDIDKDINELYADVKLWCQKEGYCDLILPQLYFGFNNESLPFEKLLSEWIEIMGENKNKLIPVLALYKSGKEDIYAGEKGKSEWQENSDIIKRQYECIKKQECVGFGLYSGSYINFSEIFLSKELFNLKSVL